MNWSRAGKALRGALLGLAVGGGLAAGGGLAVGAAGAAEMVWKFRSENPGGVDLELYAQDRSRTWPGDGQPYRLEPGESARFRIECEGDERICFGAWVRRDPATFWGAGPDGTEACTNCCAQCGSKRLRTQVLKP